MLYENKIKTYVSVEVLFDEAGHDGGSEKDGEKICPKTGTHA